MANNLSLGQRIVARVARTSSLPVRGLVTTLAPGWFFNRYYNLSKNSGDGAARVILSFDCDSARDVEALPALLQSLSSYSFKVAFACVGKLIERFPAEHRSIVAAGHEIINHTYTHPFNEELGQPLKFNRMSREEQKEEILSCHNVCKEVLGYEPVGFRIPHFAVLYTDSIYDMLSEIGYSYSSSQLTVKAPSFGVPYLANGNIVEFPVTTCPRHPFQAFDTYHAFRSKMTRHQNDTEFLAIFKKLVQIGKKKGMLINLYFDPQDMVRLQGFNRFLEYLAEEEAVVNTYRDVAGQWKGAAHG